MPTSIPTKSDILRRVFLRPYRAGSGPTFGLVTWDTRRTDWRGCTIIGYRFTMREPDSRKATLLAVGEDFAGSPMHADDSDDNIASLLTFLTLRRGDTDADFFSDDSDAMSEYRERHAETLSAYVAYRFGER